MKPTPLYDPSTVRGAYQLRYAWSAWPSQAPFPPESALLLDAVRAAWEGDGLRVLEHNWTADLVQILFSARPEVSPQRLAARAKGRLDHAARQRQLPLVFSRKLAVRGVGDNTRRDLIAYLDHQVVKESYGDERFAAQLQTCTVSDADVDLSQPDAVTHGRYWYNLHLVLVVAGRLRIGDVRALAQLRDATFRIAAKKGHRVAQLAVMPNHLHAALRPRPQESPLDVVACYQNNLAYMMNLGRLWADGYYVGTFGEYTMQAVRGE
jgi:REP element-mobilizing transposase RayT